MHPPGYSWECPQCLQTNSVSQLRCPRCNCLNPNAHHSTMRAEMATSTKSPLPIAVFWFVVAVIVLGVGVRFWMLSQEYFGKAAASRADGVMYASDCSPSVVAQGTSDVMAVEGRALDYEAYELEHAGDPCRFLALPAEIHLQKSSLTALRPPGYYLDTESDKEPNISIRLAPAQTPYPMRSFLPAVIECWKGIYTSVTCDGARYLGYHGPVTQAQINDQSGNTWRLVAAGMTLLVLVPVGLGVMYLRRM